MGIMEDEKAFWDDYLPPVDEPLTCTIERSNTPNRGISPKERAALYGEFRARIMEEAKMHIRGTYDALSDDIAKLRRKLEQLEAKLTRTDVT